MSLRAVLAKKVADKVAGKVAGKIQSLIAGDDYRYQRLDTPPGSRDSNHSSSSSGSSSSSSSGGHGPPERPPPPIEETIEAGPKDDDVVVSSIWARGNRRLLKLSILVVSVVLLLYMALSFSRITKVRSRLGSSCDTVPHGYQCYPSVARNWGQYAPFFSVEEANATAVAAADASPSLPAECHYTFAQVLSRHGGRDPTAGKSLAYAALIARIQTNVTRFVNGADGAFAFLSDYKYRLGADELTRFGERQMVHSGAHFYGRYQSLVNASSSDSVAPFVRSSGQHRVLESALNWIDGFHEARLGGPTQSVASYEQPLVIIPEDDGFNNTLSANGMCKAFSGRAGVQAQQEFAATFVPAITARLNRGLPGADLSDTETIYLMDLCPFETIADEKEGDSKGKGERMTGGRQLSPFCGLFSEEEWRNYDYFQTLGKWYGYGDGSALGATQGVGYVNELVARLTQTPVDDHTSTNQTLDANPATFPLDATLYADFSHDNDMANIFAAMGLYNQSGDGTTSPLLPSNTTRTAPEDMQGYAASWVVPFAARLYVEKMVCSGSDEELVRVLVNDRVVPLAGCGADALGRCTVDRFVESLGFARSGGRWDECFA